MTEERMTREEALDLIAKRMARFNRCLRRVVESEMSVLLRLRGETLLPGNEAAANDIGNRYRAIEDLYRAALSSRESHAAAWTVETLAEAIFDGIDGKTADDPPTWHAVSQIAARIALGAKEEEGSE